MIGLVKEAAVLTIDAYRDEPITANNSNDASETVGYITLQHPDI